MIGKIIFFKILKENSEKFEKQIEELKRNFEEKIANLQRKLTEKVELYEKNIKIIEYDNHKVFDQMKDSYETKIRVFISIIILYN